MKRKIQRWLRANLGCHKCATPVTHRAYTTGTRPNCSVTYYPKRND